MVRCFLAAAFAILATSGCTQPGASSSGGAADAGSVCEVTGTAKSCADCTTCAQMGPCSSELTACQEDSYCTALDQCVALCGANTDCKAGCADPSMDPSNYNALASCVYCTQCPVSCAGFATCM